MFTHLRQNTRGFFAKLILFMLIGMFVLWGVGDVFRSMGAESNTVVTVGKVAVTKQQFQAALSRNRGKPEETLSGLVNDALLEQEEQALGIMVGDDAVADFIGRLKEFQDKDGNFDKQRYKNALKESQKSESELMQDVRREMASKLLIGTFTGGVQVPETLVQAMYKSQAQQRSANLVYVSASDVAGRVAPVTDKEIQAYYDAHAKQFTVPEMRSLSYVVLPLADLAAKITISDEELKRAYEERKADFHRPERRLFDQMVFVNEAAVKKAEARLKAGESFETIAKSSELLNKNKLAMGELSEADLPSEAQAAGVWTIKQGGVSKPVQSDFGWHIFTLRKILPEGTLSFDEARADIARDLRLNGASEAAGKQMKNFEDTLAGGATLEKAVQSIGQSLRHIGPVKRDGTLADGGKAPLPAYPNFLAVAFATSEKDHSQAVQAADGSYFLVRVDSVAPEHVQPLAQVRSQAAKEAMAEKTGMQLQQTAQAVSEQLHAGKPLAGVLAAAHLSLAFSPSGMLTRTSETVAEGAFKGKSLPHALLGELFRIKPGEFTHAYPTGEGAYALASLSKIVPAPAKPDEKTLAPIREELKNALTDDLLHEYLNDLRARYAISVNPAALKAQIPQPGTSPGDSPDL